MGKERFTVKLGDIFRDKDPRAEGRHLKACSVEGLYARCVNCTAEGGELPGRRTRVSLHGLETRFEKVGGSRQREDLERAALAALKEWRRAEKFSDFAHQEMLHACNATSIDVAAGAFREANVQLAALRAAADELLKGEG